MLQDLVIVNMGVDRDEAIRIKADKQFFLKAKIVNILGFIGPMFSVQNCSALLPSCTESSPRQHVNE